MKEAIVWERSDRTEVEIRDVPIPQPARGQILIKVVVTGTNPKDWKLPQWVEKLNGSNPGDDIAGIVHSVGEGVYEFKAGDRVASFHKMMTAGGSFAEYALGEANATFHIPPNVSFEEAATIPLAAMTAVVALYARLGLPESGITRRSDPAFNDGLIIYGGASAVGAFALKVLRKTGFDYPVYVVAGRGLDFVKGLIDPAKGDRVFDYRQGNEALVKEVKEALNGKQPQLALNAVCDPTSYQNIGQLIHPKGRLTVLLSLSGDEPVPDSVEITRTSVGEAHQEGTKELATSWFRLFGHGLHEGWFSAHPHEVLQGGLAGLQHGLNNLREGKASAVKYVARIADTPGVEKSSNVRL